VSPGGNVLVIGVDGAAAGPGIEPGGRPLITRQEQVAPLVLRAAGLTGARTA
jgi:hypothetical protein